MILRTLITIIAFLSCVLCQAEISIDISQKNYKSTSVLVEQFTWNGKKILPEDIRQIIENDIKLSGMFKIYDSSKFFLEKANKYDSYSKLDITFVISGNISYIKNVFNIKYQLYDIKNNKYIITNSIESNIENFRDTAHKISNNIFKKITGIDGDFASKILFIKHIKSKDTSYYQLLCADSDGNNAKIILQTKEPILSPCWSPNGDKIAYVSFENKKSKIYIHDINTQKRLPIINSKGIQSSPSWSPDGKYIALTASNGNDPNIYIIDLETKKISQITFGSAINTEPSWMPDGKSIIFTSSRGCGVHIYQIYLSKGSDDRLYACSDCKKITYLGTFNARAKPFPDGKSIALIHKVKNSDKFNVATLNLESRFLKIISTSNYEDSPSISPNGQRLLFSTNKKNNDVLKIATANGNITISLPLEEGHLREPVWSPK